MNHTNCDFSPIKQEIDEKIQKLIHKLQHNLQMLGNENYCVLGSLEDITGEFVQIESLAASYYLNCYLSAFTNTYEDLSTSPH